MCSGLFSLHKWYAALSILNILLWIHNESIYWRFSFYIWQVTSHNDEFMTIIVFFQQPTHLFSLELCLFLRYVIFIHLSNFFLTCIKCYDSLISILRTNVYLIGKTFPAVVFRIKYHFQRNDKLTLYWCRQWGMIKLDNWQHDNRNIYNIIT